MQKYPNKLIPGDKIIVRDGDIQVVKNVSICDRRASIKFRSGEILIVTNNTKLPVIPGEAEQEEYTIEQMYNMILDDEISLADFTLWCHNV